MNPYGIPALIAAILNLVLAGVALLFRRREAINGWFALFTGLIALDGFANFLVTQTTGVVVLPPWLVTVVTLSSTLAFVATIGFLLALTGYMHNLRARVLGFPLWIGLIGIGTVFLATVVLSIFTDLLVKRVLFSPTGMQVEMGEGSFVFQMLMILLIVYIFALPISAIRREQDRARRRFIATVTAGLAIMYTIAAIFELMLSQYGYPSQFVSYLGFTVAAIIFYGAMLRYQFDKVDELNLHLEEKVEQRTRTLRDAQARLVQQEKMASLGRLVAGISHEFNTPMGAVLSSTETLGRSIARIEGELAGPPPEALKRLLEGMKTSRRVIEQGTRRIEQIVRRLRSFAKLDEAELQPEPIEEAIADALFLLDPALKKATRIELERIEPVQLHCYAALLNQALLNLLTNAAEAAGAGGRVRVRATAEGSQVRIEIEDDGPGMDPAQLERIFDPGYTTKGRGVGTGLGLAIVYQIVERHRGRIDVDSAPGRGTIVRLQLPIEQTARS